MKKLASLICNFPNVTVAVYFESKYREYLAMALYITLQNTTGIKLILDCFVSSIDNARFAGVDGERWREGPSGFPSLILQLQVYMKVEGYIYIKHYYYVHSIQVG